jgi:hypothetical protein
MKKAIAVIDPGSTSGLVWISRRPKFENDLPRFFSSGGEMGDRLEIPTSVPDYPLAEYVHASDLVDILSALDQIHGLRTILIEDFILRRSEKSRSLLAPVRLTAMVFTLLQERFTAKTLERIRFEYPSPGKMNVINDVRLKDLGLWLPGKPHARAATKHLVSYLRK